MMKTEARTINKHGITFLGMHYRSDYLLDLILLYSFDNKYLRVFILIS